MGKKFITTLQLKSTQFQIINWVSIRDERGITHRNGGYKNE